MQDYPYTKVTVMHSPLHKLNIIAECRTLRMRVWQCPPFLVLVVGLVTIISMIATYAIASLYTDEPQVAALIVIFVTVLFLVVGNLIISGFNKVVELNRMKSEFIAITSHQLRSPLSIFKWTLDLLERQLGKPDPVAQENSLKTLRDTTENMIRLVNALLEVSRIEAGAFALKEELFTLEDLTQKSIDNFGQFARAAHIAISLKKPATSTELKADRDRVGMVIENLIDNAIRYTRGAGHIAISIRRTDGTVRWEISDQGAGIPLKKQKFIFQKFYRAGNVADEQTQSHGSGIGLYIAKAIVEASGGHIGFISKEGDGSVFWFELPVSDNKQTTISS